MEKKSLKLCDNDQEVDISTQGSKFNLLQLT